MMEKRGERIVDIHHLLVHSPKCGLGQSQDWARPEPGTKTSPPDLPNLWQGPKGLTIFKQKNVYKIVFCYTV